MRQVGSVRELPEQQEVTVDEALRLAQGHHKAGNLIIADRTYRDILTSVEDHYPTIFFLGVLCYQRKLHDEALHFLEKSVKADPDNTEVWANYGIVLAEKGLHEEAIDAYDKAIEVDNSVASTYANKSYTYWIMGEYEKAEETARLGLDIQEGHPVCLMNLGIALGELEKFSESLSVWERLDDVMPESSQVLSNWGNVLRHLGEMEEAEEKVQQAVDLDPNNPEAWNNLGMVMADKGDYEQAEYAYRKSTNLKPDFAIGHENMALILLDAQKYAEAQIAARYALSYDKTRPLSYTAASLASKELGERDAALAFAQQAVSADPEEADAYMVLAEILLDMEYYDEGDAAMHAALELNPDSHRYYVLQARIRENLGSFEGALKSIDAAIERAPHIPTLYMKQAQMLQMSDRMDDAMDAIDKAIEMAPNNVTFILTKADLLLTTNDKDEARIYAEKAREINPNHLGVYHTMNNFKKYKEGDEDIDNLLEMYEKIEDYGPADGAALCYTLSKVYDDLGDDEKSFELLKQANDYKFKLTNFSNESRSKSFKSVRSGYNKEFIDQFEGLGYESEKPIFIVGMPRSGTTLTEQILSAHPDIFGAGELSLLSRINRELGPMSPDNVAEMGKAYVDYIEQLDKSGKALRITDKMPGNFMNVAFIHSILPNAKIIHCRRNPIDTCLSCYKQNFAYGQLWSYRLEDLAQEYQRYLNLMEYWDQVLPGRVMHIDYEETVNDFETQARRLIDFAGLEWNDACLEPHKQKRAVLTASKDQVIKPVYKTSVQKWKRYEKQLQPLVKELLPEEAL